MTEGAAGKLDDEKCASCGRLVFDGHAVRQCGKCGCYAHQICAAQSGRCPLARCAANKWVQVTVVRLQPPGPGVDEIAATVRADVEHIVEEAVTRIRGEMAYREDLEKLHGEIKTASDDARQRETALRERLDQIAADVGRRFDEVRRSLVETIQGLRAIQPVGPKELTDSVSAATRTLAERLERLQAGLASSQAAIERVVSVEAHRTLLAVEACRWDTAARRRPLPWDDSGERVLEPPAVPADTMEPERGVRP